MREVEGMSKRRYPCSASELLFRIIGYVLLFSFGMLCVTPFYLIGISSLASEPSLIRNGFRMIPEEFSLDEIGRASCRERV